MFCLWIRKILTFFFLDCKTISNLVKAKKEWCDLETWMSCHKILKYSNGQFCSSPCISSKYRSKKKGIKKTLPSLSTIFSVVGWNKGYIKTAIFLIKLKYTSYFVYTFYIKSEVSSMKIYIIVCVFSCLKLHSSH